MIRLWNGGFAPYGYKFQEIQTDRGTKKKLAIDPVEADNVRLIYKLFLEGYGAREIQKKLMDHNTKTRLNMVFSKKLILAILRNEKYKGSVTFGKNINKRNKYISVDFKPITIDKSHAHERLSYNYFLAIPYLAQL